VIGVKTIVVVVVVAIAVVVGDVDREHVAGLSVESAFAIGLFAGLGAVLLGVAWRPEHASRAAVGRGGLVVEVAADVRVRELPPIVQRAAFALVFGVVGLATFDNEATARIASAPADLVAPSRAEYCQPETVPDARPAPIAVAEPVVDEAGCALVKRAFELGYKKDLGSCAPKPAKRVSPAIQREREVCTKRQLDEPFLHFAWRKVAETASDASPVDSAGGWLDEVQIRIDYVDDLLGDIKHSVTGTPHGAHHVWINLPDPHPRTWRDRLTGHEPCTGRFADLALWPRWTADTPASTVVEHVLGQLLFATRFGTPASCSDYTLHWDAPADACTRLAADPIAFLEEAGALRSIRDVLERRTHQLALRAIASELGKPATLPEPPPARYIASAACFVVGAGEPRVSGKAIVIDGESIAMRELHAPAIRAAGSGPIDVYTSLALLLGGTRYAGPAATTRDPVAAEPVGALDDASFPLIRLEPLVDADPFTGQRGVMDESELLDVAPIERHLFAFVDAFRRDYLPQRGRL
jgi:hypothetical protein